MPPPKRLSRSKIELFANCPACFWLDVRGKIKQPSGPPFNLNSAVDHLLKNEFDAFRGGDVVPPRLAAVGIACIPAAHPQLARWRHNFTGVARHHAATGVELFGAIDDLWQDAAGTHYVVDYKATSKSAGVSLDAPWQIAYKRQVEFYQWLLRGQGLVVANRAWFVYANGLRDHRAFDDVLRFETRLIAYDGDDRWVEPMIGAAVECLAANEPPPSTPGCAFCEYVQQVTAARGAPRTGRLL